MEDFKKISGGAVINTNIDDYKKYKMSREKASREKQLLQRVNILEKQVKDLYAQLNRKEG
jgi:hypothetical protein